MSSEAPFVINGDKTYGIEKVKSGELDVYFYIPQDFKDTKKTEIYHISEGLELFNNHGSIMKGILSEYASGKVDPTDAVLLTGRFEIVDNKLTATGEEANALGKAIIPLLILVTFFLFVCLFGNRLLMTVVEEKENRISEMILTTVSSKHLIIGKIIAMMVLGVIQILSFLVPVLVIVFLNRDNPVVGPIISTLELDPVAITINGVLFVFSTLVSTARDASSFLAPVIIGTVCPFYFLQAFFATTPTFAVQFLTYFPLSAPTAMMLRTACGNLSMVELTIGLVEIVTLSVIMISLTIKMFQKNVVNFETFKPKFLRRK